MSLTLIKTVNRLRNDFLPLLAAVVCEVFSPGIQLAAFCSMPVSNDIKDGL